MNSKITYAYNLMLKKQYTCVMYNGEKVYTSSERGVKPLLDFIENEIDVKGYCVADKVVGKAAAFLYVLLGVKEIYADVISEPAAKVLEKYNISHYFNKKVELIKNRAKTGFCPMESAVININDANEAYAAIKNKLKQMGVKK